MAQARADFLLSELVFLGLPVEAIFSNHKETLKEFGNLAGSQKFNRGLPRRPNNRINKGPAAFHRDVPQPAFSISLEATLSCVKTAKMGDWEQEQSPFSWKLSGLNTTFLVLKVWK